MGEGEGNKEEKRMIGNSSYIYKQDRRKLYSKGKKEKEEERLTTKVTKNRIRNDCRDKKRHYTEM